MARINWGVFVRLFGSGKPAAAPAAEARLVVDRNIRVPVPRRRGRTPEQREADDKEYARQLRLKFTAGFEETRRQAQSIGSKKYIWRSCGDFDVCPVCAKKDGKRFAWDITPKGGHAGCSDSCPEGWCRCYAEPVLPT